MEGYKFELIQQNQFNDLDLDAWRMNIIILDLKRQIIIIGCTTYLQFFSIQGLEIKKLDKLHIGQNDIINQVKQFDNQLFVVTMDSFIYIYDLDNILIKPLKLQGLYENIDDCSIWSIDICDQYLAVGSNSQIISLWSRIILTFDKPDHKYLDDREIRVKFNKNDLLRKDIEFPIRYSIQNNKHNIPCVSFSPCNKYLASGSIDGGLRIYKVENGSLIHQILFTDWIWSIQWINCYDNQLDQQYYFIDYQQQQLQQQQQLEQEQEENNQEYKIIIGFKKYISICKFQYNIITKVINELFINNSQSCQRFQKLQYRKELNLLIGIPQHDNQICFLELYDGYKMNQNCTLQLINQNVISADIQQIYGCIDNMLVILTWQKQIRLYKVSIKI